MGTVSRRSLLHRLGLFLGAVAGGLIPGSSLLAVEQAAPTASTPTTLSLLGRDWHLYTPDRVRGELPRRGDRLSMQGQLLNGEGSGEVGQFYSACFCPDTPGQSGFFAGLTLEMHTFNLRDGTIMGIGVTGMVPGQSGQFAIVGGTGRYTGARGHYNASQDPIELTGSGRAEFQFTFMN